MAFLAPLAMEAGKAILVNEGSKIVNKALAPSSGGGALSSARAGSPTDTNYYNATQNLLSPLLDPSQDKYSQWTRSQGLRASAQGQSQMGSALNKLGFGGSTYAPAIAQQAGQQSYLPHLNAIQATADKNRGMYYQGMQNAMAGGTLEASQKAAAENADRKMYMDIATSPATSELLFGKPDKPGGLFGNTGYKDPMDWAFGEGSILGNIGKGVGDLWSNVGKNTSVNIGPAQQTYQAPSFEMPVQNVGSAEDYFYKPAFDYVNPLNLGVESGDKVGVLGYKPKPIKF